MLMLRGKRSGFTIIELLVALAIFVITIPTLAAGVRNLIVLNNRARNLTIANLVAESKAEELRSGGFNALALGTTDMSSEIPTELASPNQASYEVENTTPGLAEITINITYDDYGKDRILQYKTSVSELGVGQ